MTPQEIALLPVAPLGHDGNPHCFQCCPRNSLDPLLDAPVLAVDDTQPALCSCPKCGTANQTPAILAVAILAERLAAKGLL